MLTALCALCLAAIAGCWLLSVLTGNCSQVDRMWSILPPVYVGLIAWHAGFADPRLDLMAGLVLVWGLRLTRNFARKGGYRPGHEDYRWPVLRQRLGPLRFQLLNATFIAPFQNLLLLLLAAPAYVVLQHRGAALSRPLCWIDALAAAGFLLFVAGETLADEQQWAFHLAKQRRPSGPRFLTTGLFRYSRHPNFFCEQALWWCFALFAVAAGGDRWGPAFLGPALLTLLFQGSTAFTEQITAAKYPDYAEYQRRTSRLWPWPPRN